MGVRSKPPLQKGMHSTWRLEYYCSRGCFLRGAKLPAQAVGTPGSPGPRPTWPRPGLFVDRADRTLCWARRYCSPAILRCALDSAPNGRRRRWPDSKESAATPIRVNALRGPKNRARRDTPFRGRGVGPPRRSQRWGSVAFRRRGTAAFSGGAACAHKCGPMGPVDRVLPTRLGPELALDANIQYTPAKGRVRPDRGQ